MVRNTCTMDNLAADAMLDVPFGAYEQHVLRRYALALLTPPPGARRLDIDDGIAEWYRENRKLLGFKVGPVEAYLRQTDSDDGNTIRLLTAKLTFASGARPTLAEPTPPPSALQKRIDWIATTLRLGRADAAFLGAVVRLTLVLPFRTLYAAATDGGGEPDEVNVRVAVRIAGLPAREPRRIMNNGPLMQLGLLEDRGGGDVAVSATVVSILTRRTTNPAELRAGLFGRAPASTLTLADFEHLGATRDRLLALLSGALAAREPGASVLFWGPPGTGKTEFARLIGKELGAEAVFVGEAASDPRRRGGEEPSRNDRLAHLAFASALADRAGRVVLVIDEADDVFVGVDDEDGSSRRGSKVFMNRVVETCPVPMVWITNHAERLGPAVLRRMLMAVEFREPDARVRARIVARHAAATGLALDEAAVGTLAALPASPALLRTGLRAASLAATEAPAEVAEAVVRSLMRVAGKREAIAYPRGPMAFDAALSNADADLAAIEARVVAAGVRPLSFLFSGPPGTGKSAFARHLAERLGLPLVEKRASDLLGMYVGESEKQIAEAFAEAAEARAFLLFDEVDSLLSDRGGAQRTWEVSQVNEMLTHMERHPLPFAATTNLAARLDAAVQRRFLFKVAFREMTAAQAGEAFLRSFGVAAPAGLARLSPLTPGDFALVARKAAVLCETDPVALAALLAVEVEAKPGHGRRIGF